MHIPSIQTKLKSYRIQGMTYRFMAFFLDLVNSFIREIDLVNNNDLAISYHFFFDLARWKKLTSTSR